MEADQFIRKNEKEFVENLEKGEKYNLFDELGLNTDENKHSKFLASLLRPIGLHGKGAEFLRAFLRSVGLPDYFKNLHGVTVQTELAHIYGRFDPIIKDKHNAIVIENKIYAQNQDGQLARYYKYADENKGIENFKLFYLTRMQHNEPNSKSLKFEDIELKKNSENSEFEKGYWHISYEVHVLAWLEQVKSDNQYVKDYISVLKHLTDNEDRFDIKLNGLKPDEIRACRDLLRRDFIKGLEKKLKDKGYEVQERLGVHKKGDVERDLKPLDVKRNYGFLIVRQNRELFFEINDYSRLIYGVFNAQRREYRERLEEQGYLPENYWHCKEFKIMTEQHLTFPFYDDRLNYTMLEKSDFWQKKLAEELMNAIETLPKHVQENINN